MPSPLPQDALGVEHEISVTHIIEIAIASFRIVA